MHEYESVVGGALLRSVVLCSWYYNAGLNAIHSVSLVVFNLRLAGRSGVLLCRIGVALCSVGLGSDACFRASRQPDGVSGCPDAFFAILKSVGLVYLLDLLRDFDRIWLIVP